MGFATDDIDNTPSKPDYGIIKSDFKQQYQQLKQHRATVLSLLSDSHPEGKEATAPRSWWDWVYGWKPAPAVLTTIDGITVNEATTHGAAIRTAVDQLEHSKEAVAHLRWALVHLHATTTPAASPRAVAPTTPPRDIEAGIDHTTASAAAGTASLVLPIGDASSKKGKQLLKEQEKLDAQRSKVLELLQSEGSPAAAASEGAYEVDPASKQGKLLIQEIHKYEKQKAKLVKLAGKSGIQLRPEDLDSFGVYTDDGTAVDASSKQVKQIIKQASTAKRTGDVSGVPTPRVAAQGPVKQQPVEEMHDAASTAGYESANEGSFGSFASSPGVSARNTPMPSPAKVAHYNGVKDTHVQDDAVPLPSEQVDAPERRASWLNMFGAPK